MQALVSKGNWRTVEKLMRLKKQFERDGQYRVATRLHAIVLNIEGKTSGDIADILKVHRGNVWRWIQNWETEGADGLLEGQRPGRPRELSDAQRQQLADIIDSGPVAYGFTSGVWTSPMIAWIIEEEFDVTYHRHHVCKVLHHLGFSVQRPRRKLIKGDPEQQRVWRQWTYPAIKRVVRAEGAVLLFVDEASFRQDPTLYRTWARTGQQPQVPTTGQRNTQKFFGGVSLYNGHFSYRHDVVFNAQTYILFLERLLKRYFPRKIHSIHDNASYHKKEEVKLWFKDNRRHFQAHELPPYSPELNAIERIWHHVRMEATHDRYFPTVTELVQTVTSSFRDIQRWPSLIYGYLAPFI